MFLLCVDLNLTQGEQGLFGMQWFSFIICACLPAANLGIHTLNLNTPSSMEKQLNTCQLPQRTSFWCWLCPAQSKTSENLLQIYLKAFTYQQHRWHLKCWIIIVKSQGKRWCKCESGHRNCSLCRSLCLHRPGDNICMCQLCFTAEMVSWSAFFKILAVWLLEAEGRAAASWGEQWSAQFVLKTQMPADPVWKWKVRENAF